MTNPDHRPDHTAGTPTDDRSRRIVVWLTEDTWTACVDTVAALPDPGPVTLLHVTDARVQQTAHGALGGLLGRGRRNDPGPRLARIAEQAADRLLADARERLGRDARLLARTGRPEREVVAAADGADLLICARDGDRSRLGPASLGRDLRFVVDHAPCAVLLIWPDTVPGLGSIPPPPADPGQAGSSR